MPRKLMVSLAVTTSSFLEISSKFLISLKSLMHYICLHQLPSWILRILDSTNLAFTYSFVATWPNTILKLKAAMVKRTTYIHLALYQIKLNNIANHDLTTSFFGCWHWPFTLGMKRRHGRAEKLEFGWAVWKRTRREAMCDLPSWYFPGLPPLIGLLSPCHLWAASSTKGPEKAGSFFKSGFKKMQATKLFCPGLSS